jgi:hypothetical protein
VNQPIPSSFPGINRRVLTAIFIILKALAKVLKNSVANLLHLC